MSVTESRLTNQIICITDFKIEGKIKDITIYPNRNQEGNFIQRWKVSTDGVNLVFADNTANHFGK